MEAVWVVEMVKGMAVEVGVQEEAAMEGAVKEVDRAVWVTAAVVKEVAAKVATAAVAMAQAVREEEVAKEEEVLAEEAKAQGVWAEVVAVARAAEVLVVVVPAPEGMAADQLGVVGMAVMVAAALVVAVR